MKRLAIIATHPVQYNVPWFRRLANETGIELCVFYTWHADDQVKYDPDFQRNIAWDIPLLEGYNCRLVAPQPTVSRKTFWNLNNDISGPIEAWGPDGILVMGWNYLSHLRAMRHFSGKIPIFFRGDSTLLDHHSGCRSTLRRMLLTQVYKYVDTAFFVGKNNYDYFRKFGVGPEQLCFAPHAVDNRKFSSDGNRYEEIATDWRSSLGIGKKNIVFLFAGKLIPKKSPDLLLAAFKTFSRLRAAELVFVGQGSWEEKLRSQAHGMSNVHFLPFQNQSKMPIVYRLGDVVCLPSAGPGETWGLAINEAMACGRSVIVSDKAGCARDLVADQQTGYVHKADSQTSLLEAMQKCQNRDELVSRGKACSQFIDTWSCDAIAKQIKNRFLSAA
tara:strand:+ start:481 stop:1641 length:1161 start_codon:yes stop_codon:yes gene_type:complete